GISFSDIGIVNATGHSTTPVVYHAIDTDPVQGDSYYRLRQTDVNGNYVHADPVHVYFGRNASGIFPNPAAAGQEVILYHDATAERFTITVSGIAGSVERSIEKEKS